MQYKRANLAFRPARRTQQIRVLKRCLCISLLDLSLNLPNYLIRLYTMIMPEADVVNALSGQFFGIFEDVSQVLYFGQVRRATTNRPIPIVDCFLLVCTQRSISWRRHLPQRPSAQKEYGLSNIYAAAAVEHSQSLPKRKKKCLFVMHVT